MPQHRPAHDGHQGAHVHPTPEWADFALPPAVPTLEEIELADELRHDLEVNYLGKAEPCWDSGTAHSRWRTDEDA